MIPTLIKLQLANPKWNPKRIITQYFFQISNLSTNSKAHIQKIGKRKENKKLLIHCSKDRVQYKHYQANAIHNIFAPSIPVL